MKKIYLILLGFLVLFTTAASADVEVSGYATADNTFWVYGYDGSGNWGGSSWYPVSGYGDWRNAKYLFGNAEAYHTGDMYIAVKNTQVVNPQPPDNYPPGPLNPAGFLLSMTTPYGFFGETGTNKLMTDTTHWDIVAHSGWGADDPAFDPTALTGWGSPTSYGPNNSSTTWPLWYQVNGNNPISNIDNNAEWIWTDNNFDSGMDNYAVLRTHFTVAVPEPASMSLLGLGLAGLIGLKRKGHKVTTSQSHK